MINLLYILHNTGSVQIDNYILHNSQKFKPKVSTIQPHTINNPIKEKNITNKLVERFSTFFFFAVVIEESRIKRQNTLFIDQ